MKYRKLKSIFRFYNGYRYRDKKVLFIHQPKCAGSSITEYCKMHYFKVDTVNQSWTKVDHFSKSFDDFIKFSFIRNPWDRAISNWKMFSTWRRPSWIAAMSFEEYIEIITGASSYSKIDQFKLWEQNCENNEDRLYIESQYYISLVNHAAPLTHEFSKLISPSGNLAANFIGYFERLDEDFQTLINHFTLPSFSLNKVNPGEHRPYYEYYSNKTRKIIGDFYANDIELFNYDFKKQVSELPPPIINENLRIVKNQPHKAAHNLSS